MDPKHMTDIEKSLVRTAISGAIEARRARGEPVPGDEVAALASILAICQEATWSHSKKVARIAVIAESNILGKNNEPGGE